MAAITVKLNEDEQITKNTFYSLDLALKAFTRRTQLRFQRGCCFTNITKWKTIFFLTVDVLCANATKTF